jgi:hypothetical protein
MSLTRANAFKHCCWIGTTAYYLTGDTARGFGKRHETRNEEETAQAVGPKGPAWLQAQIAMDLHNNEVGIAFAADVKAHGPRNTAWRRLVDKCLQAARSNVSPLAWLTE